MLKKLTKTVGTTVAIEKRRKMCLLHFCKGWQPKMPLFSGYMRMPYHKFIELVNVLIGPSIYKEDVPLRTYI